MVMSRWDPFREMITLGTAMEQLLNNAFVPASARPGRTPSIAFDVAEVDEAYIVQAAVPDVNPDNLEVIVNDQTLTLRGEFQQPSLPEGARYYLQEWGAGRFERSMQFPMPLNADAVEAKYENGILTLHLPKAESAKPRRITIQNQPRQIEAQATPVQNEQQVGA